MESKKGCRWKDVTGGGIQLKAVEMPKNNALDAETDGIKGEDQVNIFVPAEGEMGREHFYGTEETQVMAPSSISGEKPHLLQKEDTSAGDGEIESK